MIRRAVIRVRDLFPNYYLATRESAQAIVDEVYPISRRSAYALVEHPSTDPIFDFDGVEFVSSSFADEFLTQLEHRELIFDRTVTNLSSDLKQLFAAVNRRRHTPVAA